MGKLADNGNLNAEYLPYFSGNWNNSDNAGTFQLHVNNSTSNSNSNIGTHSCFILLRCAMFARPLGQIQNKH